MKIFAAVMAVFVCVAACVFADEPKINKDKQKAKKAESAVALLETAKTDKQKLDAIFAWVCIEAGVTNK